MGKKGIKIKNCKCDCNLPDISNVVKVITEIMKTDFDDYAQLIQNKDWDGFSDLLYESLLLSLD